jgi:hypothetical protein
MNNLIGDYLVTAHAAFEMLRCGIDCKILRQVSGADGNSAQRRDIHSSVAFQGRIHLIVFLWMLTVNCMSKVSKY